MVAAALDFLLAGRPAPQELEPPGQKSRLHRYLYRRQVDSLGAFGRQIVRFARWMLLPDDTPHGTRRKNLSELEKIRARLDDDNPLPLGLVYVSTRDTLKIWKNHQVLAYGFRALSWGKIEMHIYDPNHPMRDDVTLRCEHAPIEQQDSEAPTLYGLICEQWVGDEKTRHVRGFFAMPYVPVTPPPYL
jgi:hypothetical protein